MRVARRFAPSEMRKEMIVRCPSIGPVLLLAALLAAAAAYVVPRGIDAQSALASEDDPAQIAERALDEKFSVTVAEQEINAALANKDADLAKSFVDLAADRHVALDPALTEKVNVAVADAQSATHAAQSFAYGLVEGEPSDMPSLVGMAVGDLFVFGDIRDVVREGSRLAMGRQADPLVLGLAAVGLAVTAGTYATLGAEAPARVGLSLAKAARKTGRLSADLTATVGRVLRGVVDWDNLKGAVAGFSLSQPALAVRAARDAVKVERAGGLVHLARDVGRVEAKAGTQAALDGLQIAESPREMSRVAKLAEKEGGKMRAILKVAGRAAIVLTGAALDLGLWVFGALLTLFGFVSTLKSATERTTWRVLQWRKRRRLNRFAALTACG